MLQYVYPIGQDEIEYLSKLSVGVVGSRMVAELMWRIGVGNVKYIGDFISASDIFKDVTLCMDDLGDIDVLHSKDNTLVVSYLLEDMNKFCENIAKILKGCDVIVSHRHVDLCAKTADRFGIPFIPPIISCILPEDISGYAKKSLFDKLECEFENLNPMIYSMLCSAQVIEFIKLCTSGNSVIAPEAYIPVEKAPYFKKVDLETLFKS